MKNNQLIPSVNFHLWEPCNMRCGFCFAKFQDVKQSILPKGHLPEFEALKVVEEIAKLGFEKITFAGGEPMLSPWLPKLIQKAKSFGLTTMLVTNGSKLSDNFLLDNKPYLDWIALSIDSLYNESNLKIGRAIVGKTPLTRAYYKAKIERIHNYGYGLKINTVVNSYNYLEDFNAFILESKPQRWKVLQVLPIKGQNDDLINEFTIKRYQFEQFLKQHELLNNMVPESNEDIKGSYVMVDPAGRFFDNSNGIHNYSTPILENGAKSALKFMNYSYSKFLNRNGIYDW